MILEIKVELLSTLSTYSEITKNRRDTYKATEYYQHTMTQHITNISRIRRFQHNVSLHWDLYVSRRMNLATLCTLSLN